MPPTSASSCSAWTDCELRCRSSIISGSRGTNPMVACKGETRRNFLTVVSVVSLDVAARAIASPASAQPENERPKEGDFLVSIHSESPVPLKAEDIPSGGPPVVAWPVEHTGNLVRKGSRLNKVLLLRLDPATLVGLTQQRAADGVVAYSA